MENMANNKEFWIALDKLVESSKIVIDRPKGSMHPNYPEYIYEIDYGFLKNTSSADGEGIDVWIGSEKNKNVSAILCTIDLLKRDSEIKILIGCSDMEKNIVFQMQNKSSNMKCILITRD